MQTHAGQMQAINAQEFIGTIEDDLSPSKVTIWEESFGRKESDRRESKNDCARLCKKKKKK